MTELNQIASIFYQRLKSIRALDLVSMLELVSDLNAGSFNNVILENFIEILVQTPN